MSTPRLLYLGQAFPPGVSARFPELQPAGHLIETNLVESVRPWFDIRSVGVSSLDLENWHPTDASSPGLPNALNLTEKPPELLHRWKALRRLQRAFQSWCDDGWRPEVIVVCNLSPIYNAFIRWLRRRPSRPRLVLYLADSATLGVKIPRSRRLRYRFKPLVYPDEEMVDCFDACVAVSRSNQARFAARGIPWLWQPNGCDPRRAIRDAGSTDGPVSFGYFGSLAEHTGLPALLQLFTARPRPNPLHLVGFGKTKTAIAELCGRQANVHFASGLTPDECLQFAQQCDVLINPRPLWPGNENNFASKVFEYALAGRAILTSRVSGVDLVLGDEACYFDEKDFERSLDQALVRVAETPRAELRRRGAAIQSRLLTEFSWQRQGERLAQFIRAVLGG